MQLKCSQLTSAALLPLWASAPSSAPTHAPLPTHPHHLQVTQLGHVKDLASAFTKVIGNGKAARQVYNISGERFVTFDGIAKACAEAMGAPEPELVSCLAQLGDQHSTGDEQHSTAQHW
jgi:nucleoside-diphosphate-sugar epimerase